MKKNKIRPLALCVFRHQNKILVSEGFDPTKNQTFYRPLGGGIEFGERSVEAARREIKEELNAEVTDLKYLGTLENIFVFDGNPGHEIVQIYDGKFVNAEFYEKTEFFGYEEGDGKFKVLWKNLGEFNSKIPLYPDGLLELLLK